MNMKNSCPHGQLFLQSVKETDTRWVSVSLVRLKGLEPTRLATREPKSRMSTNSITGAYAVDS